MTRFLAILLCWVINVVAANAQLATCTNPGSGTCLYTDSGKVTNTIPTNMGSTNLQLQGYQINVLTTGANPSSSGAASGVDNSVAINLALGYNVPSSAGLASAYIPAGIYHIKNPIFIAPGQCLIGDDMRNTYLDMDMDFSPSASAAIIVVTTGSKVDNQPCIKNIGVFQHLPPDITATASAATSGSSSITVSGATGTITNGMYVWDSTTQAAIPIANGAAPTTVSGVAGNVISISPNLVANVNSADVIHFSQPRSGFAALGTCNTSVAGGAPCQYPYEVYNNGAQNFFMDNFFFPNAYNGINQIGQTFHFGFIQGSAFNIGLNSGNSANFPQIDDFEFWNFDIVQASWAGLQAPTALADVYYDGSTIAATIGSTEGLGIGKLQTWVGQVNLTGSLGWGHIDSLMLDGSNSNLNVTNCNWWQIGNMYSTKGAYSIGIPINFTPTASGCRMYISNLVTTNQATAYNGMYVHNGLLAILGGRLWNGIPGNSAITDILQDGGNLQISNTKMDCGGIGNGNTYVTQTGGAIQFTDNDFLCVPNGGGTAALSLVDNAGNLVRDNRPNGLTFTAPGTLGLYEWNNTTPNQTILGTNGTTTVNTPLVIEGTGSGDANQGAQFEMFNVNASNPKKFFRVNSSGILQILNSAYTANIATFTDAGLATIFGGMLHTGTTAPTLASGQGSDYASATGGHIISGQGSTYDVELVNNAGALVLGVPTGGTSINVAGNVTVQGGIETLAGSTVDLKIDNTAQGTDQKYWSIFDGSGNLAIRSVNDAYNASSNWIVLYRGAGYGLNYMAFNAPFIETGSAPTLVTGQGGVYADPANGGVYSGFGSTNDVTLTNNTGAVALAIPTGGTSVVITNGLKANPITANDAAAPDHRWYNSGNGADQKYTSCYEDTSGNFKCRFANDAFSASNTFLQANRGSGYTISSLALAEPVTSITRLSISDVGQCTMATGTCSAQSLATTYNAAPKCFANWTGTGTLAGQIKMASTTTTVTPSSSTGTDTAQVNWHCFGN